MLFRIHPLEERILLDAALAQGIADAFDADGDEGQEYVDDHVDENTASNQEHESSNDSVDSTVDLPANETIQQLRVLVVSSEVKDPVILTEAAQDGVLIVEYDAEITSLDQLSEKIAEILNGQQATSIAFANHGEAAEFHLTQDINVTMEAIENDGDLRDFWHSLGEMLHEEGRIDLLACNFAQTAEGQALTFALAGLVNESTDANVYVAASIDPTGSELLGGDWVLEVGNIDIQQQYFAITTLEQWDGLFASPAPTDDIASTNEDTPVSIDVLVNDDYVGPPTTIWESIQTPTTQGGTVTGGVVGGVANSNLIYTPPQDFFGTDTFIYALREGSNTGDATVTITVSPVNDAPVAVNDEFTVVEQAEVLDVLANDSDADNDNLSVIIVTGPNYGTAAVNADGTITYKRDSSGFIGEDVFYYKISDGQVQSNNAKVTLQVLESSQSASSRTGRSTTFYAADVYYMGETESETEHVNLVLPPSTPTEGLAQQTEAGDSIIAERVGAEEFTPPMTHQTMTGPAFTETRAGGYHFQELGTFTYSPDLSFQGEDSFSYTFGENQQITVTINVYSLEYAYQSLREAGKTGDIFASLGFSEALADKEKNLQLLFGPENGLLQINEDGSFTYIPEAGFEGSDQFIFEVVDETGAVAGQSIVQVNVGTKEKSPTEK